MSEGKGLKKADVKKAGRQVAGALWRMIEEYTEKNVVPKLQRAYEIGFEDAARCIEDGIEIDAVLDD